MSNGNCGCSIDCAWGCPGCEAEGMTEVPEWSTVTVHRDNAWLAQRRDVWKGWHVAIVSALMILAATTDLSVAADVKDRLGLMAREIHDMLYTERR